MKYSKQNQVGNFEKLVSFTNAQGAVYNPGEDSIKSAALQSLLTQAQGTIQAAYVSRTAYINAVRKRAALAETIPRMATCLLGNLQACKASPETIDAFMMIKRRFHPSHTSPVVATTEGETPGKRKKAQFDFDSLLSNFQQLVLVATSDPKYTSNDAEFTPEGLNTFIASFHSAMSAVADAEAKMKDVDRDVNEIIYGKAGIYGYAMAAKGYVKSRFGYGSAEFREVSRFNFRSR
jgi:hypothetical protein